MRRIATVLAGGLLIAALSGCDEEKPATVTALAPAAPVSNWQTPQTPASGPQTPLSAGKSRSGRHRSHDTDEEWNENYPIRERTRTSEREEDEEYDDTGERYSMSDRGARDHDAGAVRHWTDGFGRTHAYTDEEADANEDGTRNMAVNAPSYFRPWHAYDKNCDDDSDKR